MSNELKSDLKKLIVDKLMLSMSPEEIQDDQPLFGPGGLGLDSVDALQLVVSLEKEYQLKLSSPEAAKDILKNVSSLEAAIRNHQAGSA